MACNNCFNGCTETTSDKCVMYTGLSYSSLGIETGDSLHSVETAIITYLQKALDGTGIVITIDPLVLCPIIQGFLPGSGNITLVNYITALIQTACSLQDQLDIVVTAVNNIETNYVVDCLSGVAPGDGTHAILQAVITKLCTVEDAVSALALDLVTNYVNIADIDSYISTYITNNPSEVVSSLMRNRMVPNTIVEYYGSLSFFDGTGAGTGDWAQVYLCNGNNGTPDKRGRSPIGVVTGMGGGAYSPVVNPVNPANPNYTILGTGGANTVTLTIDQIPSHTHVATVSEIPDHTHNQTGKVEAGSNEGSSGNDNPINGSYPTSPAGGHTHTVTNAPIGGSGAHSNVHPVLACYYIMYIPTL